MQENNVTDEDLEDEEWIENLEAVAHVFENLELLICIHIKDQSMQKRVRKDVKYLHEKCQNVFFLMTAISQLDYEIDNERTVEILPYQIDTSVQVFFKMLESQCADWDPLKSHQYVQNEILKSDEGTRQKWIKSSKSEQLTDNNKTVGEKASSHKLANEKEERDQMRQILSEHPLFSRIMKGNPSFLRDNADLVATYGIRDGLKKLEDITKQTDSAWIQGSIDLNLIQQMNWRRQ